MSKDYLERSYTDWKEQFYPKRIEANYQFARYIAEHGTSLCNPVMDTRGRSLCS